MLVMKHQRNYNNINTLYNTNEFQMKEEIQPIDVLHQSDEEQTNEYHNDFYNNQNIYQKKQIYTPEIQTENYHKISIKLHCENHQLKLHLKRNENIFLAITNELNKNQIDSNKYQFYFNGIVILNEMTLNDLELKENDSIDCLQINEWNYSKNFNEWNFDNNILRIKSPSFYDQNLNYCFNPHAFL